MENQLQKKLAEISNPMEPPMKVMCSRKYVDGLDCPGGAMIQVTIFDGPRVFVALLCEGCALSPEVKKYMRFV